MLSVSPFFQSLRYGSQCEYLLCKTSYDCNICFSLGEFYWKVHPDGISERYPRKISDDWDGLEGYLDASVTWSNGKTFFFKVIDK